MPNKTFGYFILLLSIISFSSCQDDESFIRELSKLETEIDSVIFDTVFTSVGSATKVFVLRNTTQEGLLIDEIILAGGEKSSYRLNINGLPGVSFSDVEIPAEDSIYCFVDVTVDPNSGTNPFVVKDSIIFKTETAQKDIKLISWGQNAHFHYREKITEDATWTSDKPHVLYGLNFVAKGATLTINECTQVHGHPFSRLIVKANSSLKTNGTASCPVVFQGDRLEESYEEVAGQWIGIQFYPRSKENHLIYTIIKNGYIGVEVDSLSKQGNVAKLVMDNCQITTMNSACVAAYQGSIIATNCNFNNSCQFLFFANYGGVYDFKYCTFGNFQKSCVRTDPSVYLANTDFENSNGDKIKNDLTFSLINNIIYGSQQDELLFDQGGSGEFNAVIDHNLIRSTDTETLNVNDNILNMDPRFVNTQNLDYRLDSLSPAQGKAIYLDEIRRDYFGKLRDASTPDLGAFEREE